jgi:hypothetical protein
MECALMNRKMSLRLICLILISIVIVGVVACSSDAKKKAPATKTAVDSARFVEVVEKHGFEASELDTRPEDFVGLEQWFVGADEPLRIHFLVYDTADNAQAYLDNLRSVNDKRKNADSETTKGDNYDYYVVTIGETYSIVSRVDNTLIHIMATTDMRESMDEIISELGY